MEQLGDKWVSEMAKKNSRMERKKKECREREKKIGRLGEKEEYKE